MTLASDPAPAPAAVAARQEQAPRSPARGQAPPCAAAPAYAPADNADLPLDKSDAFRISAYKVLLCSNRAQHDW